LEEGPLHISAEEKQWVDTPGKRVDIATHWFRPQNAPSSILPRFAGEDATARDGLQELDVREGGLRPRGGGGRAARAPSHLSCREVTLSLGPLASPPACPEKSAERRPSSSTLRKMLRKRPPPLPNPRGMPRNPWVSQHLHFPRGRISSDLQHTNPSPASGSARMLQMSELYLLRSGFLLQNPALMLRS